MQYQIRAGFIYLLISFDFQRRISTKVTSQKQNVINVFFALSLLFFLAYLFLQLPFRQSFNCRTYLFHRKHLTSQCSSIQKKPSNKKSFSFKIKKAHSLHLILYRWLIMTLICVNFLHVIISRSSKISI